MNNDLSNLLSVLNCDFKNGKDKLIDDWDFQSVIEGLNPEDDLPMKRADALARLCKKNYICQAGPLINNQNFIDLVGEDWEYLKELRAENLS